MNFRIISALIWRYLFLYTRTPMRLVELVFWPMVDLLVWGNLTVYIEHQGGLGGPEDIDKFKLLIGGVILWDVLFRAQQGVAVSFLEDVWTRNLLNVFVAPVRNAEYVLATFCVGIMRIIVTVGLMMLVAFFIYEYSVFAMGWSLLPFFVNLLVCGWSLGMISTALILRWGQAAESLAWAVPFFIQPFVAAFYSVESIKPTWMQHFSMILPPTHVFEGMREVMRAGGSFSMHHFLWASGLNVIFMAIAAWIFASTLAATRRRGLLTKFATQ